MNKFLISLIISTILFNFLPFKINADGMVIPRPDYYVRESGQKAVIFYEKGRETLILSITFIGDAKDFGWVIPVPQRPEVTKGSDEVFTSLSEITKKYPRYYYPLAPMMKEGLGGEGEPVTVIETKKIDYYDIVVLSATDSQALSQWLSENGYQYPEESAYILQDYIANNWYFVAVKISPEAAGAKEVAAGLEEGHATPLKIEFNSQAIIYPFRISAIQSRNGTVKLSDYLILDKTRIEHLKNIGYEELSQKETGPDIFSQIVQDVFSEKSYFESEASIYPLIISEEIYDEQSCSYLTDCRYLVEGWFNNYFYQQGLYYYDSYQQDYFSIYLYVIADHKKEIPGFYTEYANWIGAKDIRKLAFDINGKPLIEPQGKKYYLTYFYRNMSIREINQDLIIRDAENNDRVNAPNPWLNLLWGSLIALGVIFFWLFSPLGLIFITLTLIRALVRSRAAEIVGKVFQILIFIITLGFFIISLVVALKFADLVTEKVWLIGATSGLGIILISQIIVIIKQSKLISQKSSKKTSSKKEIFG